MRNSGLRMALAAGILAAAGLSSGCARWFLLHPRTGPASIPTGREVRIPYGDGSLQAVVQRRNVAPDGEPCLYVLELIGNAARAEGGSDLPERVTRDIPVEIWVLNYPGFGGSDGRAVMRAIPPAVLTAYDALREQAGDRPVVIYGQSMGGAAALYITASRPVDAVILHNPPPLRQIILGRFGWWNLWILAIPVAIQVPDRLDAVMNASRSTMPAAFVMAGSDEIVPVRFQEQVIHAYAGPAEVFRMPGYHHNSGMSPDTASAVGDWLRRTVLPRPETPAATAGSPPCAAE